MLFFRAVLGSQQNLAEGTAFPYISLLPFEASSSVNIPHPSGTFVTKDEPTLAHHHPPTSIVYFRVHSWCCSFYGF